MKVVALDEKKNLVVENKLYNLKLKDEDKTSDADEAPTITTVVEPGTGKTLETRGLDALTEANVLPGLDPTTFSSLLYNLYPLPPKPVKPGDSWSDDVKVQLPTGQKATAQRKLTLLSVGSEKDGKASARIKTEMTLPINVTVEGDNGGTLTGSQNGTGECRILLEDGMPVESHTSVKMQVTAKPSKPSLDDKGKPKDSAVQVTTQIEVQAKRIPDEEPPVKKAEKSPDSEKAPEPQKSPTQEGKGNP
jgi:hypothetical protein